MIKRPCMNPERKDSVPDMIMVDKMGFVPIEKQRIEVVERRGRGHPDFIADSISEAFSRNLSRYYLNNFGQVLDHRVDMMEVVGGKVITEFGGGKIVKPISILFSGSAPGTHNGVQVPIRDLALDSAKDWLTDNMRFLGSDSVSYIFQSDTFDDTASGRYETKPSNYCIPVGIGYAPLSYTEQAVLEVERVFNSREFKEMHPFSGEDVRVFATRRNSKVEISIANAFVDRYISSVSDYYDKKAELYDELNSVLLDNLPEDYSFKIGINNLDIRTKDKDGCFLTVTGTGAENGEWGIPGRGNRTNGVISFNRVMPSDSAAGRNPMSNTSKLYNLLAFQIAAGIFRETGKEVTVRIIGRSGYVLDYPVATAISTWPKPDPVETIEIRKIAAGLIENMPNISIELIQGSLSLF